MIKNDLATGWRLAWIYEGFLGSFALINFVIRWVLFLFVLFFIVFPMVAICFMISRWETQSICNNFKIHNQIAEWRSAGCDPTPYVPTFHKGWQQEQLELQKQKGFVEDQVEQQRQSNLPHQIYPHQ